jgi:hypothetical protein
MPANYVLLEKITVGAAGAASVTFSGIPQTGYTDLVLKISARGGQANTYATYTLAFNGSTSNRSMKQIYANGSTVTSSSDANIGADGVGSTATANTFSNGEIYIPNYTSSNFKSLSLDNVTENNATEAWTELYAPLWSDTAAITSIVITSLSSNFAQYSTFYLYGVAKLGTTPAIVPYATGGDTIMTDGTYWYHTFVSSGTFTPQKAISCDYLVVAGGGGGGIGGGGAGGLRSTVTATGGGGSLESALSLANGTGYTVTIGAGGGGYAQGSNSVFSTITSTGGGAGQISSPGAGGSGGSGGGAAGNYNSSAQTGGTATANQGYAGGGTNNFTSPTANTSGGGGGGAGAAGTNATRTGTDSAQGGNGGNGVATSISGTSVTYAGGGGGIGLGGGGYQNGTGGTGGGAAGNGGGAGINGTANTGGGGGGGYSVSYGSGGSGIVIVRYAV